MIDARSILDILLGGAGPRGSSGRQPADPTVFTDMLDQLGTQDTAPSAGRRAAPDAGPQQVPGGRRTEQRSPRSPQHTGQPAPGGMSLEDLLRSALGGAAPQADRQQQWPAGEGQAAPGGQQGPAMPAEVGEELQNLLRQILQGGRGGATPSAQVSRVIGETGGAGGEEPSAAGGLAEILKQVLGQATAGVREGAARI